MSQVTQCCLVIALCGMVAPWWHGGTMNILFATCVIVVIITIRPCLHLTSNGAQMAVIIEIKCEKL